MKFLILMILAATAALGQASPRSRAAANADPSATAPYVGVYLAEIDGARAKALKLREERGVEVTKVEEDSPAAKAGIRAGDVVLEYSGQRVEGIEQFRRFVRETPANREVKVQVSREGNVQNLLVKAGSRKVGGGMEMAMPMAPEIRIERPGMLLWSRTTLGVEADTLDGQLAAYFGVREGVLVRSVVKGSAAERAGMRAGDVIVKVDDTKIATAQELTRAVRAMRASAKKSYGVVVMRERKEAALTVTAGDDDRSETPGWPEFSRPLG